MRYVGSMYFLLWKCLYWSNLQKWKSSPFLSFLLVSHFMELQHVICFMAFNVCSKNPSEQYSQSWGGWLWGQPGLYLACIWGPELFFPVAVKVEKIRGRVTGASARCCGEWTGAALLLSGKGHLDKEISLSPWCSFRKAGKPEKSWWCLKQPLVILHIEKPGKAHVSYSSEVFKTVLLHLLSCFLLAGRWLVSRSWGCMNFLLLLMQSCHIVLGGSRCLAGGSNLYLRLLGMG